MARNIELNKTVYSKNQYPRVIDTDFQHLGITTLQEDLSQQTTVEDFFELYDELFYDIPAQGEFNSHITLIERSTEYANYEQTSEEVEALQEEIASLRRELLDTQMQLANSIVSGSANTTS